MARFDFENLDVWDVNTNTLLPVGNHVCTITSAAPGRSKNKNPQIELEVAGEKGTRKDWLVYTNEQSAGKVVALFKAAGVALPSGDDQDSDGVLTEACVKRLVDAKVGVIVREEDKFGDPTKKVPRIKGYVAPSVIGEPVGAATGSVRDEDIPF